MVHRTTPWSKSSSDTFDVDDGGCFGCCCSSSLGSSLTIFYFIFLFFRFFVKMSILIEITNGQPIPLMWYLFILFFLEY